MGEVFKAPWAVSLIVITAVISLLLVGISLTGILTGSRSGVIIVMIVIPLLILFISALFSVRGYRLVDSTLYIQRLGWDSKIDLQNLTTADVDPQAMKNSRRTWGNGGLFSFSGWFYNPTIGTYQAYATDPQQAVILRFPERTIVLTPDQPESFVSKVLERRNE